ncbi:hypothetical protein NRIC_21140 [Enterococcus florum]|uniref:Pentapeptide repeat-containing protein n=1 Tax=Enterococcus florum TaxID=2480627 RepID=A0A4P5PLS8_9ENTE|nr:pentapeptide repeat-containing protein [Enterococcus florum]GCF94223.1 hypothetical protein NRIC_21140 [Enterococcus florum]
MKIQTKTETGKKKRHIEIKEELTVLKYENRELLKNGTLSIGTLQILFILSFLLTVFLVWLIPKIWADRIDISLQSLVVITAGIPTIYLWIINQRKKERQIILEMERELNVRFVKSVELFSNRETFMAGCYSLATLINDWSEMDVSIQKAHSQMEKSARVLFNVDREDSRLSDQKILDQYLALLRETFVSTLRIGDSVIDYNLKLLNLSMLDLHNYSTQYSYIGYDWIHDLEKLRNLTSFTSDFRETNFEFCDFTYSGLSWFLFCRSNLKGADFSHAKLFNTNFAGANLKNSRFLNTFLVDADFSNADLTNAIFINCNLEGARFNNANVSGIQITEDLLSYLQAGGIDTSNIEPIKEIRWE